MTFNHPRGALGFHQWQSTDTANEDSCIGCGVTTVNFGEPGSVVVDYGPLPIMCPGPGVADTRAHHFGEFRDGGLACHWCPATITETTDPSDVDWICHHDDCACEACQLDDTTLLEERPEGVYYLGPLGPAKAYLHEWYGDRLHEVTLAGDAVRVGEHLEGDADPSSWGTSESGDWDEAWRFFAGVDFGPIDEEYDEAALRTLLRKYANKEAA